MDDLANSDQFVNNKKSNILNLIKGVNIDKGLSQLGSAFDEYREGMVYLMLKSKFQKVEKVPEGEKRTPDFKIDISIDSAIYAELKTMSFADGNLNYLTVMKEGLQSQIDIEGQIKEGKRVAFGITSIAPWRKSNRDYDPYSILFAIETLIEKIEQNIKKGQFSMGNTVLIVDTKQLAMPNSYMEGGVPVYIGGMYYSLISGVQWNVSFGKMGHMIYRSIEFEGKENVDGELKRNGILHNREWIKAICFITHTSKDVKITGLHRHGEKSDAVLHFLNQFCDFVNDELNTNGWEAVASFISTLK